MIRYIEGKLLKKEEDRVVVLANGVGYEILLPAIVRKTFASKRAGEDGEIIKLYIYYHQTERQPKPLLIGFNFEPEKEFFEKFITVSGIGPKAAVKALSTPITKIVKAIAQGDLDTLKSLPGIGEQRAKEIIAKLQKKVGKFGLIQEPGGEPLTKAMPDFQEEAMEVLLQLQYKKSEANEMIQKALERSPNIKTAEELLNEVYRQKTNLK